MMKISKNKGIYLPQKINKKIINNNHKKHNRNNNKNKKIIIRVGLLNP